MAASGSRPHETSGWVAGEIPERVIGVEPQAATGVVPALAQHLRDSLTEIGAVDGADIPLIVACSGGLDSMVLLHLLRFATEGWFGPGQVGLTVAHLDHAMREASRSDAEWLGGVCRAWDISMHSVRLNAAPASEAEARTARYAFLESVRSVVGAGWVLTAHHADDQAETVLFRVLRGSGLDGLRGIPGARSPGIARPLLGVWREDLERYARSVRLRWREDATNDHLGFARNVLRHEIIPVAEDRVAVGARRALVRLADVAAQNEMAWAEVLPAILETLEVEEGLESTSVSVPALAALGKSLRARVLRDLVRRFGRTLDHTASTRAVRFIETGRSGALLELGGGIELRRELDRFAIGVASFVPSDEPLTILNPGSGAGQALLGGRSVTVSWSTEEGPEEGPSANDSAVARFSRDALRFPLTVRARKPGDRIACHGGTRKVKKALLEARIPSAARDSVPLLLDGRGQVLWVVGVARTNLVGAEGETMTLRVGPTVEVGQ